MKLVLNSLDPHCIDFRNEVWRYTMDGSKGLSVFRRMTKSLFRGFPIAVGVTAVLVCGEKVYSRIYPSAHHGDHH